ncbi:MAG: bleomycin hydrolase, partial [Oceanospirillaceae bacterium]
MKLNRILLGLAATATFATSAFAQDTIRNREDGEYFFTIVKNLDANPVESQDRTGTCWSFSTLSYLESELLRTGKGKHILSEMYIVRKAYEDKAVNYVRMNGHFNFGAGGAFQDIPYVIKKYGIVPQVEYIGREYGGEKHNHAEMDDILKATMEVVVKNPQKTLTKSWKKAVSGILDAYLGEEPETFTYEGKEYTPASFADELGLNMDDYVSLTSYTHHPFYTKFNLEIPDNWAFGLSYNVPLDDITRVMDHAINTGYTFAWGADVSEKGFSFKNGLAITPVDEETVKVKGKDNKHFSDAGAEKISSAFDEPVEEKWVTQEERQEAFDNYQTTDDHGMHITGLVKDQKGNDYYLVKNSWGLKHNDCDGYFY